MSEEPKTTVEVKGGKIRTYLQVGTLTLLTVCVAVFWLFSDRHNDDRYISKEKYKEDRASDERLNLEIVKNINWRADLTDKKLDTLSEDIKTLTRRYSAQ